MCARARASNHPPRATPGDADGRRRRRRRGDGDGGTDHRRRRDVVVVVVGETGWSLIVDESGGGIFPGEWHLVGARREEEDEGDEGDGDEGDGDAVEGVRLRRGNEAVFGRRRTGRDDDEDADVDARRRQRAKTRDGDGGFGGERGGVGDGGGACGGVLRGVFGRWGDGAKGERGAGDGGEDGGERVRVGAVRELVE